jgi:exonuclease SbcC
MKNWQISKIEVSSFKAFKHIYLDLDNSSLLTLDGPNGFGKTSIFDAIELLLTGQIKRIHNLFSTLMTQNKRNYEDNLFWNIRSGKKDLVIKIEFFNEERTLTLARHASAKTFNTKSNNRADKFSHFKLYELPDFTSNDFLLENLREDDRIEELFGENFRENFSYLNYLEQGQNQLLHTRVDERKDALGNLFNINDITAEIENCQTVALKLTRYIGDDKRKADEEKLTDECASLRSMVQADLGNVEYKKLSTADLQPGWDKDILFPAYSAEIHTQYLESTRKLQELLPLKAAIRVRDQNEQIETDIEQNKAPLRSLAEFGTDLKKMVTLDNARKELDQLAKANAVLKRGTTVIKLEEAESLPGWAVGRMKWFEEKIKQRDELQQQNQSKDSVAAELARLKNQMLEEHAKLHPNDKDCPLCGADWKTHDAMVRAIDERSQKLTDSLSDDGRSLVTLITLMTDELAPIVTYIREREAELSNEYNEVLYNALNRDRVRLQNIAQLADRLQNSGTPINFPFTESAEVVDARLQELITSMRTKKTAETEALPDDWKQTISSVFKDIQDFYIIEQQDLKNKDLYISIKFNEAQSEKLQECIEGLQKIQRENDAAARAKEKVTKLRNTLAKVERIYADHTISEIELIFHIYSGRLIQNYQRGLGLFIESRDGKQLRFLTAEKSEHDAVLSMSSGQVSALSLAFFLSLNKVYARIPLILIDDPAQSLDEVNVASLTDLLRCELKHRQLIVSSHEEAISSYMRYRFTKAGLTTRSLNMQRLAKEAF